MSYSNDNFFWRQVTVHGVMVEVEFRFYQAIPATEYEPESPEEILIEAVYVDQLDITRLCGESTMKLIEEEILKLYDNKEYV